MKCLKARLSGGQAWFFIESMRQAKQESIRTNSKMRRCQKVLGYDANALYLSTMLGTMPCGKEVIVHWLQTSGNIKSFFAVLQGDKWFGFAEIDIQVPREFWKKFEEMPPLFYNKPLPSRAVPQHMKEYLTHSKSKPMHNLQKLVASFQPRRSCCMHHVEMVS